MHDRWTVVCVLGNFEIALLLVESRILLEKMGWDRFRSILDLPATFLARSDEQAIFRDDWIIMYHLTIIQSIKGPYWRPCSISIGHGWWCDTQTHTDTWSLEVQILNIQCSDSLPVNDHSLMSDDCLINLFIEPLIELPFYESIKKLLFPKKVHLSTTARGLFGKTVCLHKHAFNPFRMFSLYGQTFLVYNSWIRFSVCEIAPSGAALKKS